MMSVVSPRAARLTCSSAFQNPHALDSVSSSERAVGSSHSSRWVASRSPGPPQRALCSPPGSSAGKLIDPGGHCQPAPAPSFCRNRVSANLGHERTFRGRQARTRFRNWKIKPDMLGAVIGSRGGTGIPSGASPGTRLRRRFGCRSSENVEQGSTCRCLTVGRMISSPCAISRSTPPQGVHLFTSPVCRRPGQVPDVMSSRA